MSHGARHGSICPPQSVTFGIRFAASRRILERATSTERGAIRAIRAKIGSKIARYHEACSLNGGQWSHLGIVFAHPGSRHLDQANEGSRRPVRPHRRPSGRRCSFSSALGPALRCSAAPRLLRRPGAVRTFGDPRSASPILGARAPSSPSNRSALRRPLPCMYESPRGGRAVTWRRMARGRPSR
jgi:hypothetical protein